MAFGKRLKQARELRNVSQTELAQNIQGLSQQAIANAENRDSDSNKFLFHIADALRVDPRWLATGSGEMESQANVTSSALNATERSYPLISYVQAGSWTEANDIYQPGDADIWLKSVKNLGKHGYILKVKGDSMTNPHGSPSFPEDMLIFVKPECDCQPNDYVIAKREADNEATFKQLKLIDNELYLHAINPNWPTRYIRLEEGDKICGRVEFAGFTL